MSPVSRTGYARQKQMPPRSPLDFDISVTADKARRARQRGMSGAVGSSGKSCEWPGCEETGAYRALA